jgi:hypothetical protein
MAKTLSLRRSVWTLALIGLLWYPVHATAQDYDAKTEEVFQAVARIMGISIREEIPRPRILVGTEVDPTTFSRYAGFDTEGKIFSAYFPEPNLIVLHRWARHTLAHEFTHYFQVMYWGMTANDPRDTLERQATTIEAHFRDQERMGDESEASAR